MGDIFYKKFLSDIPLNARGLTHYPFARAGGLTHFPFGCARAPTHFLFGCAKYSLICIPR